MAADCVSRQAIRTRRSRLPRRRWRSAWRRAPDWLRARALVIAVAQASRDDVSYAETHQRLSQARALFERAGDRRQVGSCAADDGVCVSRSGRDRSTLKRKSVRCVEICEELEHQIGQAVARMVQVWVAIARGDTTAGRTAACADDRDGAGQRLPGAAVLLRGRPGGAAMLPTATSPSAARTSGRSGALEDSLGGEGATAIRRARRGASPRTRSRARARAARRRSPQTALR